jgi:hypothetical protein
VGACLPLLLFVFFLEGGSGPSKGKEDRLGCTWLVLYN